MPNPNSNGPPFVSGCELTASGLNKGFALVNSGTVATPPQTAPRTVCGFTNFLVSSGNAADVPSNFVCNADDIASVITATPGSTVVNTTALAGYLHNRTPNIGNAGDGVAIFGFAQSEVNGSFSWGLNTVTNDIPGLTGVTLQGAEIDVNVFSSGTTANGVTVIGKSQAQPVSSAAFLAGSLSVQSIGSVLYTLGSFVSFDGVSTTALSAGAAGAPQPNLGSQTVNFNWYDASTVGHAIKMGAGNTGALNVVSNVASGTTGIGFFNNGSSSVGTAANLSVASLSGSLSISETQATASTSAGTIINSGTAGLSIGPGTGGLFFVSLGTAAHSGTTTCLGIDQATGKVYGSTTVTTC